MKHSILTVLLMMFFLGCGKDALLQSQSPSFARDIEPLLNKSCGFTNCHGGINTQPTGGVMVLETGSIYGSIYNVRSFIMPQLMRVRPFQPDSSVLVKKVRCDSDAPGSCMPFFGQPLNKAQINLIVAWVAAGALNN